VQDEIFFEFGKIYNHSLKNISFLQINQIKDSYTNTIAEGYIGLMPGNQNNFINVLKNLSYIDYNIFSIYTKKDEGNSSNIIFGGYDLRGIIEQNRNLSKIDTIKTVNASSWAVKLKSAKFEDGGILNFDYSKKMILFDPSLPHIYLPYDDF